MNKWPTKKQINEALDEMDSGLASRPLPAQASPVDRFKYSLCSQFVVYMNTRKISQQELAQLLGVDKSITSKIVHYHFDDFTSDRLIKYLSILDPDVKIEVKAKVA